MERCRRSISAPHRAGGPPMRWLIDIAAVAAGAYVAKQAGASTERIGQAVILDAKNVADIEAIGFFAQSYKFSGGALNSSTSH